MRELWKEIGMEQTAFVKFRGQKVIKGWPQKLKEAQKEKTFEIDGVTYRRIPHDGEYGNCHDCSAKKGELHVVGCDMERCPKCGGQSISCECDTNGELSEDETCPHCGR